MKLRECALDLLARREHSQLELKQKLIAKGYAANDVEPLLAQLIQESLQSDKRYTEAYVRVRVAAGFGPRRIKMELQRRGISDSLIEAYVHQDEEFWWQLLSSVWQKKYGTKRALNVRAYAKELRFLTQRGFEPEQIHKLLQQQHEIEY